MGKTKLSIIIPAYNAEPYLGELVDCLRPQIPYAKNMPVEVIIIDDGSKEPVLYAASWLKVYHQKNQGVSVARNAGIDKAKGDYISFIDADDLVSDNFISTILEKTKDEPDVIELSWRTLTKDNWDIDQRLRSENDRLPNPSVCTRVFKRSYIGDVRFNVKKDSTEDEDFCRKMGYLDPESDFERAVITDYMYYYRDTVSMSKTKRYAAGLMNTKRVVYFYNHVSSDMKWLIEDIKKDDELNEVFLMTYQNDIPELKRYCQIIKPCQAWGHILKGEHYSGLTLREPPIRTQVVIYRKHYPKIGGLMTFTINFIEALGDKYDITVVCDDMEMSRLMQLLPKVRVIADPNHRMIYCDSLIVLSFLDHLPKNIDAKKVIRMCHACKTDPSWKIPQDYDELLYVSQAAADSFDDPDGKVLHNINAQKTKEPMLLVSAVRLPAPDKGDIEKRMRKLADMLNAAEIPFVWLNFSDGGIQSPPKHFYNVGVSFDVPSVLKMATYSVLLSDCECWPYACLESLMANTPVICTPFESAKEMGVKDGVNGYIVPYDMDFDVTKLLKVPKFKYDYDNEAIRQQWIDILGDTKPRHDYEPGKLVMTKVIGDYDDMLLHEHMTKGRQVVMTMQRAEQVRNAGYIEIIGGV